MLKDKLANISRSSNSSTCLLCREIAQMDRETLDAFIKAMLSNASASQILQVLNEEGIGSFKLTHLRDKRRQCFKSNQECPCVKEAKND